MCVVCLLFEKDKITRGEAMKAFWEQIKTAETEEERQHIRDMYTELDQGNIGNEDA